MRRLLFPCLLGWLAGCPDSDPECRADLTVYGDGDGDGYGAGEPRLVCALAAGESESPLDCDDAAADVFPGAHERCDDRDEDCDGEIDEGFDKRQLFEDQDGDGYGGTWPTKLACSPEPGWTLKSLDCDDADPLISPEGVEVCGGGDEDCDGLDGEFDDDVDPDSFLDFYRDADQDSFGDPDTIARACVPPPGYVTEPSDCNDRDDTITRFSFFADEDGDGFGDPESLAYGCRVGNGLVLNDDDCDDTDPELLDERDWYDDPDGDGYGSGPSVGFGCTAPVRHSTNRAGDCDESDPGENPGTPEVCDDVADQNCDGLVDCADSDCVGFATCVPPCADDVIPSVESWSQSGDTTGTGDDRTPPCSGSSTAPELAFQFIAPTAGMYRIDTVGSAYDTVLYVLDGCGGASLGCNDDSIGLQSRVDVALDAGQSVIIYVDGYGSGRGAYTLNLEL